MKAAERFNKLLEQSKQSPEFRTEKAILGLTEEILAQMKRQDVSRTELARRLGKNPAFVTKLLRGNNNFTFDTVVRIARALEMEFVPHMMPEGWQSRIFDFSSARAEEESKPLAEVKREYTASVNTSTGGDYAEIALVA
ncbi:MAG: helix-turn-helix transcriptional regulator [Kiritimatiellales bacterium]|jgi:plasmid maintenance system antidote protein VapI